MANLFQYYNTGDDTENHPISGSEKFAQSFQVVSSHTITSIKLKLYRTGSPGTINVDIHEITGPGDQYFPGGASLCSGTYDGNSLITSIPGEWVEITLDSGYLLEEDEYYAIVVQVPSANASNTVHWRFDDSSPLYEDGQKCYYNGSTWLHTSSDDMMFEEWGEADVVRQDYYIADDNFSAAITNGHPEYWKAQSFTANQSYNIEFIRLKMFKDAAANAGTLTVSIKAVDGSGHPTDDDLAFGTYVGNDLPSSAEWIKITLNDQYALVGSTQYAIVVRLSSIAGGNAYIRVRNGGTYAGGQLEQSNDGGSSWTGYSAYDAVFETWGNTGVAPTITDQSTDTDADYGDDVSFYVTATGTPTPTYQWYKSGSPITGETSSTLNLTSVDATDGGTYYCIATNDSGSDQSSDIVLQIKPYITDQSSSTSFALGALASISVTADGSPSVTYQWYKNSIAISGATFAIYSFYAASSHTGTYKCTVTNAAGSTNSSNIVLTIVDNPYSYNFFDMPFDITREN